MLSCKKATHLISEAQDRSLTVTEKAALATHLLMCYGCRRYREQTAALRTLCQQHPARPRPDSDEDGAP